jgi:hypothetical protein
LISPTHASGALIIFGGGGGGGGGGGSSTSDATPARLFTYVERSLDGSEVSRRHAPAFFNTGGGFIKRQ